MGSPKRRDRVRATDPEVLAERMPDELKIDRNSITSTEELGAYFGAVTDWLNTQVPGHGGELLFPVLRGSGDFPDWSIADWYRLRLTGRL